ncbi:hypothetical protein Glove_362g72 [Diversispora epigaea]|uniref:Protein kinase domain-containing protein n=1 Tax=Diversispora epigaea TaxID=1348612 RepID=A0A397H9K2_9GLOM|nr:hypothetical protein Glove_362g72 [Diversispora epigaea]
MSDNIPPSVEVVKIWSPKEVIIFLESKKDELFLYDEDINIIKKNRVAGSDFLEFSQEDLERWRMPGGPAKRIMNLVNKIKGKSKYHPKQISRSSTPEEENDSTKRRKLEERYAKTVKMGKEASSPSTGAVSSVFSNNQKLYPTIFMGRPFDRIGPPIVLFHNCFGQFLKDISDDNLSIDCEMYFDAQKLMATASQFFTNELSRNLAMEREFAKIIGEPFKPFIYGNDNRADGTLSTNIQDQIAYRLILEVKKELGGTKAEPTLQAGLYYLGYWSEEQSVKVRARCCCPSYIMAVAGPWVCVFGGIYIDMVVIEPLTDFISLIPKSRDDNHVYRIARFLQALKLAMGRLNNFYQNLKLGEPPNDQHFFPYTNTYRDQTSATIKFTYLYPLTDDFYKTLWKAATNSNLIVIKFTQRYNMKAHNICALLGLAPKLLHCSDNEQGFKMIVMDYIDGVPLTKEKISTLDNKVCRSIFNNVKEAIKALHDQELVFADLRRPNILVVEEQNQCKGVLVDFSWCGTHDRDTYPLAMNTEIPWPHDARPGAHLKKIHDNYWLDVLKEDLKLTREIGKVYNGSGWTLIQIEMIYINAYIFRRAAGGSYKSIPKRLANTKCTIVTCPLQQSFETRGIRKSRGMIKDDKCHYLDKRHPSPRMTVYSSWHKNVFLWMTEDDGKQEEGL